MLRHKLPGALFLTAALIAGAAVLRDDPEPATVELPDPQLMAANAYGFDPLPEVAAMWRHRVQRDPGDYLSRTQLGKTLIGLARETGDLRLYERAEAHLRVAAAEAPDDPAAVSGLASSLSAQHEFDDALHLLRRLRRERPQDRGVQASIADANLDLGHYDRAFEEIEDLVAAMPESMATLSRQARVAALTGRNEDAVDYARRSLLLAANIGLRPADAASAWFSLAYFQYQAGQIEDAESSLRSGLSIDDEHLPSRELLAKVLVAEGRLDDAATLYEELVDETPAADLYGLLAEVYDAQGRHDDADAMVRLGLDLAGDAGRTVPGRAPPPGGVLRRHRPGAVPRADGGGRRHPRGRGWPRPPGLGPLPQRRPRRCPRRAGSGARASARSTPRCSSTPG